MNQKILLKHGGYRTYPNTGNFWNIENENDWEEYIMFHVHQCPTCNTYWPCDNEQCDNNDECGIHNQN